SAAGSGRVVSCERDRAEIGNAGVRGGCGTTFRRPAQLDDLHARAVRGFKLGADVGQEYDGGWRQPDRLGNAQVRTAFALAANLGVEPAVEQTGEITRFGVAEEQFLRGYRAGRVYVQLQPLCFPLAQLFRYLGVDVRLVIARFVTGFPDHALQGLERCGLAVLVDPAKQSFSDAVRMRVVDARLACGGVEPARHCRIIAVRFDETCQVCARVRKQHVLDERDRTGRAFDVGEHGAHTGCLHPAHAAVP